MTAADPEGGAPPAAATGPAGDRSHAEVTPPASSGKNRVLGLVKLAIAIAIVAFLLKSDKLNLGLVGAKIAASPGRVGLAALLVGGAVLCGAVRWLVLLRGQGIGVGLGDATRLTLIGQFFNLILFGGVGGDVVKAFYIARASRSADRMPEAISSVMLDRLIGLSALVCIAVAATFSVPAQVADQPKMAMVRLSVLGAGGGLIVLAAIVAIGWVPGFLPATPRRMLQSLMRLRRRGSGFVPAFGLSLVAHGLAVAALVVLGRAAGETDLPATAYAVICPVGLFANSLPFTPMGIGVGETAFNTLFAWAAGTDESLGAEICVMLRVSQVGWSAVGALVYAFTRPVREVTLLGSDEVVAGGA